MIQINLRFGRMYKPILWESILKILEPILPFLVCLKIIRILIETYTLDISKIQIYPIEDVGRVMITSSNGQFVKVDKDRIEIENDILTVDVSNLEANFGSKNGFFLHWA